MTHQRPECPGPVLGLQVHSHAFTSSVGIKDADPSHEVRPAVLYVVRASPQGFPKGLSTLRTSVLSAPLKEHNKKG